RGCGLMGLSADQPVGGGPILAGRGGVVQGTRIRLIEQQGVGADQELPRTVPSGGDVLGKRLVRARLPDGAQRLGKAVMARTVGGGGARRITVAQQMLERLR